MADGRQDMATVLAMGVGVLPVIGGIDFRLALWLPGKPAEGHVPQRLFDKLAG